MMHEPVGRRGSRMAASSPAAEFWYAWVFAERSMTQMQQLLGRARAVLTDNYGGRQPIVMSRGEGSFVYDADGRRYIDLFAGFGGAILGHCHPALVEAVTTQARRLWHVGNVFYNQPQIELGERLNRHAFAGQAFFCHSGLEANEAACKLARLRGRDASPRRWKVISLHKSFHGRSLAMIAATGNPRIRAGFEPVVEGFSQVEPGDIGALERAIEPETAAVIMEPIQGEGGVNVFPPEYFVQVRELCDSRGLTLIFDEVWTGCGRTGRWFAHQHFARPAGGVVEPDIMTLGKAVGGGLPVGVMYARPQVAALLAPGTHGCTLGGNAICMAAACRVFDVIESQGLLEHAAAMGTLAVERLRRSAAAGRIAQIRGRGLMLGIELTEVPSGLMEAALERAVIVNVTAQKVVRLAPALNIPQAVWEEGLDALIATIASL
jgi:acetylornithine/N-succinyldiaminopimelate aminotransferase